MFKNVKGIKKSFVALLAVGIMAGSMNPLYANVPNHKFGKESDPYYEKGSYNGKTSYEIGTKIKRINAGPTDLIYKIDEVINIVISKDGTINKEEVDDTIRIFERGLSIGCNNQFDGRLKLNPFFNSKIEGFDMDNPEPGIYTLILDAYNTDVAYEGKIGGTLYGEVKVVVRKDGEAAPTAPTKVDMSKVDRNTYSFPDFKRDDTKISEDKIEKVYSLFENGIISGNQYGRVEPNKKLTRAEFAALLVSGLELQGKGECQGFSDTKGHWAESAIKIAVDNGLLSGVGEGIFDPNGSLTIEQVSTILSRILVKNGNARELTDEEIKQYTSWTRGFTWGKQGYAICRSCGFYENQGLAEATDKVTKLSALVSIYDIRDYIIKH